MLNIFLLIFEWIGIWDGINFLLCCLKSFLNDFKIDDVLENYNNSVIPYFSLGKTTFGKKRFYVFFIYIMSLLFNVIFWNGTIIYYLIPLFTFPHITEYLLEFNWMNRLYYKSKNLIRKSFKLVISNQLSNLLNFFGKNILDANTEINKHDLYYWINTINYEKIWTCIKSLSYCGVIVYLSSSDYLKFLPFTSQNKQLVYHKDNIRKLLENKEMDKILESDSIYSMYNIFKNSSNNKIKLLLQQKINNFNFIMSFIYLFWSCASILSYLEIPYGFSLSLVTILLKSYFVPLKIDSIFILFLSNYIPSPPLIILLSWIFTFKSFYLNINIELLISLIFILFNLISKWFTSYLFIFFYIGLNMILVYLPHHLIKTNNIKYMNMDNLFLMKKHMIKIAILNMIIMLNSFNLGHIISVGSIYYYYHVLSKVKKNKEIELKIVHNHFKKLSKSMLLSKSNSNINLEQMNSLIKSNWTNDTNIDSVLVQKNKISGDYENKINPINDYFGLEKYIFDNQVTNKKDN